MTKEIENLTGKGEEVKEFFRDIFRFHVFLTSIAVICHPSSSTGGPGAAEFLCHTLEQRHVVTDVLQLCENGGKW